MKSPAPRRSAPLEAAIAELRRVPKPAKPLAVPRMDEREYLRIPRRKPRECRRAVREYLIRGTLPKGVENEVFAVWVKNCAELLVELNGSNDYNDAWYRPLIEE